MLVKHGIETPRLGLVPIHTILWAKKHKRVSNVICVGACIPRDKLLVEKVIYLNVLGGVSREVICL